MQLQSRAFADRCVRHTAAQRAPSPCSPMGMRERRPSKRSSRRPDSRVVRVYTKDELLRLFECETLVQLRVKLTTLGVPFRYISRTRYIAVIDYELPKDLRQRAQRMFPTIGNTM